MLGSHKILAFLGARDPVATMAFYRDTLGLPLVSQDAQALVFDAGGTTLRITFVQELAPAKYTVLGWEVPDIAAAIAGLHAAGVQFDRYRGLVQDDLGVWESPAGSKVAWFTDPSGNVLNITQFSRTAVRP